MMLKKPQKFSSNYSSNWIMNMTIGVFVLLFSQAVFFAKGDLAGIFDPCCYEGVQWSAASYRCDNYPAPVANISDNDQAACLSVIEVCCMKQTQLNTCEAGKQTALDKLVCAIRDADPGAEQFRECCHCCQLGLVSSQLSSTCTGPNLGEPCDSKFKECCKGEATENLSFSGGYTQPLEGGEDQSGAIDRETTLIGNFNAGSKENDLPEAGERRLDEASIGDINECSMFPGQVCSHFCINTDEGFYCACPEGLALDPNDNRTCIPASGDVQAQTGDTLTCELSNPCEQQCVDRSEGGIECRCYEGYTLASDATSCEDVDECEEGLVVCSPGQRCVNTRGRYTCISSRCPEGFELNPLTGQCDPGTERCSPGFAFNSVTGRCEDLNECGLGTDTCGIGERCENTIGSYACRRERHCGTGYTLDERTQRCQDNNECLLGTHNCDGGYRCQNTLGSFRCVPKDCPNGHRFDLVEGDCVLVQCPVGLRPNEAGNCVDINECAEYGNAACRRHQRCVNTRGSFYCRNFVNCPSGYEPTENSGCQDINECERGTHKCGTEQQCVNRQGTYFCQCPRGLRHDSSGRCVDVDECSYGAAICPSNSKCVNTIGSFKCDCVDGLVADGNDECGDVDECEMEGICQQNCVNVLGTFFCSCNRGYQLRDDKRSCEDIDECTQFGGGRGRGRSGVCGGRCVNLPGSYRCECPEGWRLKPDSRSCEDINECKEGSAYCPHSESICINTRGGYKCPIVRCPDGFIKTNTSRNQNSGFIAEEDGVVCNKIDCTYGDRECYANKTKTIVWQFLPLPNLDFITAPLSILNIRTTGYSRYPNLKLRIIGGNQDRMFDTAVNGDKASLRLLRPLKGPTEREVTLELENRNFRGDVVLSRHVTHVTLLVAGGEVNS